MFLVVAGGSDVDRHAHRSVARGIRGARSSRYDYRMLIATVSCWTGPPRERAILDAAEQLLLQRGVAETSLTQVARKARVTKSLIHHYFGSKDALWTAVKRRRFTLYVDDQLAEIRPPAESAEAVLRASIERYFRFLSRNPDTVRLFARMWLEGDTALDDLDRKVTAAGVEAIRCAQQEGQLRADVDPLHMIGVFVCASLGWFTFRHVSVSTSPPAGDEASLRDLVRIFFHGALPAHG